MRLIDLTGDRFGKLVVTSQAPRQRDTMWNCVCDCGATTVVRASHLKDGDTISCGCSRLERFHDLTGQVFGRLTVVERAPNKGKGAETRAMWRCVCECGGESVIACHTLKAGNTRSCGCLKVEVGIKNGRARKTHGMTDTQAWICWMSMGQRCRNKKHDDFHNYGGRGITICKRWESFENFFADMGHPPPGMSIERDDVNGNYEPGNCRWATPVEQGRNKRVNRIIAAFGRSMTLADWGDATGLGTTTISCRIKSGWSVEKALTTKPGNNAGGKRSHLFVGEKLLLDVVPDTSVI